MRSQWPRDGPFPAHPAGATHFPAALGVAPPRRTFFRYDSSSLLDCGRKLRRRGATGFSHTLFGRSDSPGVRRRTSSGQDLLGSTWGSLTTRLIAGNTRLDCECVAHGYKWRWGGGRPWRWERTNGLAFTPLAGAGPWLRHRTVDPWNSGAVEKGPTVRLLKCSTALRAQPAGVFEQREES